MELIVLVGCIGSGKSTYAHQLIDFYRISQDDQGKSGHVDVFNNALYKSQYRNIVIDRMGFNKEQRARYINPARALGYKITIVEFLTPFDVCRERALKRDNHPNIKQGDKETVDKVIRFYQNNYEKPTIEECDEIHYI